MSNCHKEKRKRVHLEMTLYLDNFNGTSFDPSDPTSNYMFFGVPNLYVANDGVATMSPGNGLTIQSSPFTFSMNSGLDHTKYLTFCKTPFSVPFDSRKEILFEATMSSVQTGLDTIPDVLKAQIGSLDGISDAETDPRPCCAAFNVVDFSTLLVFDFIITNKSVYALIERLPFNLREWGGNGSYNSYTHLVKVYTKSSPGEVLNLGISYHHSTGCVKWIIGSKVVYGIDNPGKFLDSKIRTIQITPIGQACYPELLVKSTQLWVGFGTFSLLESTAPENPNRISNKGLVDLSLNGAYPYADPNGAPTNQPSVRLNYLATVSDLNNSTVFGQGSNLNITKLKVSTRAYVPCKVQLVHFV